MNFQNKYKNRDPIETINIIKNFFSKNNIVIKEESLIQSISGTWSISLYAIYNDNEICMSNGKGANANYALASGYAELYERFCNKIYLYANFPLSIFMKDISKDLNGYFFHPHEKVFSFEDGVQQSEKIYNVLQKINIFDIISLNLHHEWIGLPFYNLTNNLDKKFLDPRVLYLLEGSTGMASGNTKTEALISAISEQFEHQVRWDFVELIKNNPIYLLDLKDLTNKDLQQTISLIQKENELYIYDASYYYNTPVLFGLLLNKELKTATLNISCHPVFDIALERICTELFQGIQSYKTKNNLIMPSREKREEYFWAETNGTFSSMTSFPEELLLKTPIKCKNGNQDVFLSAAEYDESILYSYYINLCKQLNYHVYYCDHSLDDKMFAIKLYVEEIINIPAVFLQEIPKKSKFALLNFYYLIDEFIFSASLNLTARQDLIFSYNNLNSYERLSFNMWRGKNPFNIFKPYIPTNFFLLLSELFYAPDNFYKNDALINSLDDDLFKSSYREYALKCKYLNSNKYTFNEIKQFLHFFDIEITENDKIGYTNKHYLMDQVIFNNIYDLYHGQKIQEYINLLTSIPYANI